MARYLFFAADSAGAGVTGLTPVVDTWRTDVDGAPGAGSPTIAEVGASNAPGWYSAVISTTEVIIATVDFTASTTSVRGPDGAMSGSRRVSFTVRPEDYAITSTRAANLDAITETRLAELDPANLPTDVAGVPTALLGAAITGGTPADALERIIAVLLEVRLAELDAGNLPTDIAGVPQAVVDLPIGTPSADTVGDHLYFEAEGLTGVAAVAALIPKVWDELGSDHVLADSFGLIVQMAAGLAGFRARVDPTAFDGDLPTAITITLHKNDADVETGNDPLATFSVVNTYNATNLDLSKSKKV
jgi:hypothetical protein